MDIPSISAVIVAVGVLVGVVLAILELRNITKTRQMELVMGIFSLFGIREFVDAWGFVKKLWQAVLERPVKVELIQSVVFGAQECKFAIHL